jgi:putative glutamine amidotransferase
MTPPKPLIGCTTYQKVINQTQPIAVYGLMPTYTAAVSAAGGIPVLIPLGLSEDDLLALFERLDGVLLPGGGDVDPEEYGGRMDVTVWGIDPDRDRTELFLARAAVDRHKPLLAICRGIQVFNVALGGTLWEDIPTLVPGALPHDLGNDHPRHHLAHTVAVEPGTRLAAQLEQAETWVNSLHHQAVRDVAPGLVVSAVAPDGIIEAAEVPGHPYAIGVQWHPENLAPGDPAMQRLFRGLVEAAQRQPA